ncbi:MAG: hypothetical protein JWM28_3427 [Chitinophagaceae bacterium]|nr:hypothetical protein [Chitinophagaceae bacterium]
MPNTYPPTIENKVKAAIQKVNGDNNPDPTTLPSTKKMADFSFSSVQYISLTRKCNRIAKAQQANAAKIATAAVLGATTVQDCIDLVNTAIANPVPTNP